MAKTTQSVQYAAQVAATAAFGSRLDDKRQIEGTIQYSQIKVVVTADNVATDVITLLDLPPGAIVYPELSKIVVTDDMTSGNLTIHIGDVVDVDRYCASANCASVGEVSFLSAGIPDGMTTRKQVAVADASTTLLATLATFSATIEAGVFYVILAWKSL